MDHNTECICLTNIFNQNPKNEKRNNSKRLKSRRQNNSPLVQYAEPASLQLQIMAIVNPLDLGDLVISDQY